MTLIIKVTGQQIYQYLYWRWQLPVCAACCAVLPCRSAWCPAGWCEAEPPCPPAWSSVTEHLWTNKHTHKRQDYSLYQCLWWHSVCKKPLYIFVNTVGLRKRSSCSPVDAGCVHEIRDVSTGLLDHLKGFLHLQLFRDITAESHVVNWKADT